MWTPPDAARTARGPPGPAADPVTPRLELRAVSISFGARPVLDAVDLAVAPGEVHGLVGQHGSGKSTIVRILAGCHSPDRGGEIRLGGSPARTPIRPAVLRARGISIVHQDIGRPDIGRHDIAPPRRPDWRPDWRTDWRPESRVASGLLARLELSVDPGTPAGALGPAERSIVAIARAVRTQRPGEGVLVLDEATRALPAHSRCVLHRVLREIAADGGSALLVTADPAEAMAVTDRVTVLRAGRVTAVLSTLDTSTVELASLMRRGGTPIR
jgi:ribose transport system ATP-binding protein